MLDAGSCCFGQRLTLSSNTLPCALSCLRLPKSSSPRLTGTDRPAMTSLLVHRFEPMAATPVLSLSSWSLEAFVNTKEQRKHPRAGVGDILGIVGDASRYMRTNTREGLR